MTLQTYFFYLFYLTIILKISILNELFRYLKIFFLNMEKSNDNVLL